MLDRCSRIAAHQRWCGQALLMPLMVGKHSHRRVAVGFTASVRSCVRGSPRRVWRSWVRFARSGETPIPQSKIDEIIDLTQNYRRKVKPIGAVARCCCAGVEVDVQLCGTRASNRIVQTSNCPTPAF